MLAGSLVDVDCEDVELGVLEPVISSGILPNVIKLLLLWYLLFLLLLKLFCRLLNSVLVAMGVLEVVVSRLTCSYYWCFHYTVIEGVTQYVYT